jgi:hypothetical protein
MASSSADPLPCPQCSFPESGFKGFVFPVLAIDFEASRETERHKNLWRLSCSCGVSVNGQREQLVRDWNLTCMEGITQLLAIRYIDAIHIRAYYGEATIE